MESERILALENSLHKLSVENENLRNDLLKIQKQFEDALLFEKDLNDLREEFSELNGRYRNACSEKDNLSQRLHISLQKIDELTLEVQKQKEINLSSNDQIIDRYNKKIDDISLNYKSKIKDLEEKLIESDKNNIRNSEHTEKLVKQFSYLLELVSKYFNIEVNTFDDAIKALSSPIIQNNSHCISEIKMNDTKVEYINNVSKEDNTSQTFLDITHEIRCAKKDLKKRFAKQHKAIVNELIDDFKQKESELNTKINKLEQFLSDKTSEINSLETKNFELLNEKMMLKTQNDILIQKNTQEINDKVFNLEQQKNNLTMDNDNLKSELSEMKKQIQTLVFKLQNYERNIAVLKSDNSNLEQKVLILENAKTLLEEQINKLNEQEALADDQTKTFTTRLNERIVKIKELQTTISNMSIENEKLKQDLFHVKGELQHQISETENHKGDINTLQSSLNDYQKKFRTADDENKSLSTKLIVATKEIQELKSRLLTSTSNPEDSELIPLSIWKSVPFPQELSTMIAEIALNESFKTPTKLKNIFLIINKWYTEEVNRVTSEFSNANTNLEKIMDENKELITNFKQLIAMVDSSCETVNEKSISKYRKYIKDMEFNFAKEVDKRRKLDEALLNIFNVIEADNLPDCLSKINDLKRIAYSLSKTIKNIKAKHKKKEINFRAHVEDIEESINMLLQEKSQLQNDLNKANNDIETINDNKKAIEQSLEKISIENEHKLKEIELTNNAKITELTKKVEELTECYNAEVINKTKISSELEDLRQKNLQLEAQVDEALSLCDVKNKNIHQLKQQLKENEDLWRSRQESQREVITSKNESIIQNLTQLLEEHKEVIKHLENENSNYKIINSDLELKLRGVELKITSLNSEFQREKALLESKYRAEKLSLESLFDEKIAEYSKKLDNEKRNMYALVGMNFSALVNTNSNLDSIGFEMVIKNASKLLQRFLEEDSRLRKLLSLGPEQSIVDAVASILLK